jgi:hypothetical protein
MKWRLHLAPVRAMATDVRTMLCMLSGNTPSPDTLHHLSVALTVLLPDFQTTDVQLEL